MPTYIQKDQRTGIWVKRSYSATVIVTTLFASSLVVGMILLRSQCDVWSESYEKYGNVTYYMGIVLAALTGITLLLSLVFLIFEKTFWHRKLGHPFYEETGLDDSILPEVKTVRHSHHVQENK